MKDMARRFFDEKDEKIPVSGRVPKRLLTRARELYAERNQDAALENSQALFSMAALGIVCIEGEHEKKIAAHRICELKRTRPRPRSSAASTQIV